MRKFWSSSPSKPSITSSSSYREVAGTSVLSREAVALQVMVRSLWKARLILRNKLKVTPIPSLRFEIAIETDLPLKVVEEGLPFRLT